MAQMTEQIKIPEKELSDKDTANLSDAEFKTLVIRMLTEMIEYRCKIKELKAIWSEIKENIQEINFQEVQEAQRAPKKLDPRRNTPRHIIILGNDPRLNARTYIQDYCIQQSYHLEWKGR